MHVFHADESWDQSKFVLTALSIEDASWRAAFNATKTFRQMLKTNRGIKVSAELHAYSFVRNVSDGISSQALSLLTVQRQGLRSFARISPNSCPGIGRIISTSV